MLQRRIRCHRRLPALRGHPISRRTVHTSSPRYVFPFVPSSVSISLTSLQSCIKHTVFWRLVLGINLLYELALVFLLFQDLASARAMMRFLDPSLGVPLPEKSYAENCEFMVKNVWVSVPLRTCSFVRRPDTCADGRRNVERSRHLLSRTCAGLVRQGPYSQGLLVLLGACR